MEERLSRDFKMSNKTEERNERRKNRTEIKRRRKL